MPLSYWLSLLMMAAALFWVLSGVLTSAPPEAHNRANSISDNHNNPIMKVSVMDVQAREVHREVIVQGEIIPWRQVTLKAKTGSQVIDLPVARGQRVTLGKTLVRLANEGRQAQLEQAQAEVTSQEIDAEAKRELDRQGLQTETQLRAAEALLAAAEAQLKKARLQLEYLQIKAPFSGILQQRFVELGSHVDRGDPVALIVDNSKLKATGQVSQKSAGKVQLGQPVRVQLLDGTETTGTITYISSLGDEQTHSFTIEAEVPNPTGALKAGVSAQLSIVVGSGQAHFLSPSLLSLNTKGEVGVKTINDNDEVEFHPVTLVRTEADGVWLSGLPKRITVITQGQGFVSSGDTVIPVAETQG